MYPANYSAFTHSATDLQKYMTQHALIRYATIKYKNSPGSHLHNVKMSPLPTPQEVAEEEQGSIFRLQRRQTGQDSEEILRNRRAKRAFDCYR